jgi:ABC-type antimicrobial peptide transport system permease subunit
VDATLAAGGAAAMDAFYEDTIARERLTAWMTAAFGLFGLLLAVLGVHGLTAFALGQRVPEIGLRLALGAEPRQIVALVVVRGLRASLLGLAGGVLAAWFVLRLLARLMPGLQSSTGLGLVSAVSVLLLATLVAAYLPARRAARVDPVAALRHE